MASKKLHAMMVQIAVERRVLLQSRFDGEASDSEDNQVLLASGFVPPD